MNQHLKSILNFIEQGKSLLPAEKDAVLKSLKNADKELEITAIALEAQKRELEIESSLERVRAVAMGMNKADDLLNVCEILFHELQNLEFGELRNALINIHDDSKGSFLNYDFSDEMGKSITTVLYSAHPFIAKQLKQVRSARDAFSETILTGKELKEWIEARKRNGEKDDPRLENAESLYYYFYSIGTGAIGISTLNSIGKTKLDLLKRFRNVFSLSYQRYIDITKAEKQAREAQIEAALERVRARTMAMQKSDELADVATLLFRQVNDLGIKTWTTGFNIWSDDNNAYEDWIASPGGGFIEPYVIDATAFSEFKALSDAKKSGTEFFIRDQEGEILQETYKQLSRFATKNQFEKILEEGFEFPSRQFVHLVFGPKVSLMFITYEPVPEAHDIFKRFGKVFEQTYTRFLDLQKAEAQAREAQIEAALEKVRSASMAMHLSHELKQVINVVTEQFQHLGFKLDTANFITNYSESGGDWWISTPGVSTPTHVYIPSTDIPFFNNLATSMRKGIGFFTEFFSSEEKNEFFNYVFENTSLKIISDKRKRYIYQASGIASSSVLSKNVIFSIAFLNFF